MTSHPAAATAAATPAIAQGSPADVVAVPAAHLPKAVATTASDSLVLEGCREVVLEGRLV